MINFLPEGYVDPNLRRKNEILRGYRSKLKTNPIYALHKLHSFDAIENEDLRVACENPKNQTKVVNFAKGMGYDCDYTEGDEGTGPKGS